MHMICFLLFLIEWIGWYKCGIEFKYLSLLKINRADNIRILANKGWLL